MSPAAPAPQPVGDVCNMVPDVSMSTAPTGTLAGSFGASFFHSLSLGSPFAQEYHQAPQGYITDALSRFPMSPRAFASRPDTMPLFRETQILEDMQLDEEVKQRRAHTSMVRPWSYLGRSDCNDCNDCNQSSCTQDSRIPNSPGFEFNSPIHTVSDCLFRVKFVLTSEGVCSNHKCPRERPQYLSVGTL
jgi:hypothetical protein